MADNKIRKEQIEDYISDSAQSALNLKANDNAVIHNTGNETKTGDLTVNGNLSSTQNIKTSAPLPIAANDLTRKDFVEDSIEAAVQDIEGQLADKADLVDGVVPANQLPSYVDDVLEFNTFSDFPVTGESGKIYVALDTNLTYRWGGTQYVEISASLALGETSSTAYRGDRGKIAYDHSQIIAGNPHNTTKADVGLGNADNTSDINKPISTATQAALDLKAPLASPNLTGIPTVPTAAPNTSTTQIASTEFVTSAVTASAAAVIAQTITDGVTTSAPSQDAVFDALALKAPLNSPSLTGTPLAPTAGAGTNTTQIATTAFVKTTADAKVQDAINDNNTTTAPSQNAVFDALALKAPLASPNLTGVPLSPTATPGTNSNQIASTAFVTDAVTNRALTNGKIFIGNASNIATEQTVTGDVTITNAGVTSILGTGTGSVWVRQASPTLTGTPFAPTAAPGNNSTQIATTAFVTAAAAATISQTITDGVTTSSPSQNAVFDALALKANDTDVLHISGNETATGLKTFQSGLNVTATGTNRPQINFVATGSNAYPIIGFTDNRAGGAGWNIEVGNQLGTLDFYSTQGQQFSILQDGRTSIGTLSAFARLTLADGPGGSQIAMTRGTGGYTMAMATNDNSLIFYAGVGSGTTGTTRFFSDGNVIISNNILINNGYKLDVNGTGRFTGQLTIPDGTATTSAVSLGQLNTKANTNGSNASGTWSNIVAGNSNGLGGYQYIDSLLTGANVGNFLIRKADNTSWSVASQATIITTLGINLKANDSDVVHIAGTETITGSKTFSQQINYTSSLIDSSMKDWFTVKMKIESGGWARGFRVTNSGTTDFVSFGALGSGQALTYGYIGLDGLSTNAPIKFTSTGVGIGLGGTSVPTTDFDVSGNTKMSGSLNIGNATYATYKVGIFNNNATSGSIYGLAVGSTRGGMSIQGDTVNTQTTDYLLNVGKSSNPSAGAGQSVFGLLVRGDGRLATGAITDTGEQFQVYGTSKFSDELSVATNIKSSRYELPFLAATASRAWAWRNDQTVAGDFTLGTFTDKTNSTFLNRFYITPTGNTIIGGTTDGGFKFDVQGTGRFTGQVTVPSGTTAGAAVNKSQLDLKSDEIRTLSVSGTEIATGSNLNNFTVTGLYFCQSNAIAASGTNFPIGLAGKLETVVRAAATDAIYQTYHVYQSVNSIYYRCSFGGVWSTWKLLSDDANTLHKSGDELKTTGTTQFRNTVSIGTTVIPSGSGILNVSGNTTIFGAVTASSGANFGGPVLVGYAPNIDLSEAINRQWFNDKVGRKGQANVNPSAGTVINIAHGLASTPIFCQLQFDKTGSDEIKSYTVTLNSTNIVITFANLPSETSARIWWQASLAY